jgi:hypothetical protein
MRRFIEKRGDGPKDVGRALHRVIEAGTPIAAVSAVDATRSVRVFFMAGSPFIC